MFVVCLQVCKGCHAAMQTSDSDSMAMPAPHRMQVTRQVHRQLCSPVAMAGTMLSASGRSFVCGRPWVYRSQVLKRVVQTDSSSLELSVSGEDDEGRQSSPTRRSEPEPLDHAILQVSATIGLHGSPGQSFNMWLWKVPSNSMVKRFAMRA